jgi:hypothetical protein
MLEPALHAYLSDKTAIIDLVGNQIYANHLPPRWNKRPSVSFHRAATEHEHDIAGAVGCARVRMQIDCWSQSYETALEISEAVRESLQGYRGLIGAVEVTSCTLLNTILLPEEPAKADDAWIYHVALDFLMIHRESRPQF